MANAQRLTNSSDETELAHLLSGDLIFSIPYFQRAYKWKPEKLKQLEQDLLSIIDAEDTHFLGAVIVYARRTNPADPNVYEVIDGQQRTTTVFLYIAAVVRALCKQKLYEEAAGLFLKYLVIGVGRETRMASNAKLHSCKEDRAQLNRVFEHLLSDKGFAEAVSPFKYKPLPASGANSGRLWNNFRAALRFLDAQVELEGEDRLKAIYRALLNSVSVVQIVVRNPTDGPKIFDSLNSRQEPITTGDLVRNEVFAKIANEAPETIEAMDLRHWQPFYSKFMDGEKSLFDAYFFPYGLIHDPNTRKSEVFEKLRQQWKDIADPTKIIEELSTYQDAFLDIVRGTNTQSLSKEVHRAFGRLTSANAPSATYPFTVQLAHAVKAGTVSDSDAVGVLSVIESFLVRRAICGHEPTGLHAVFKRLWQDCFGEPNAANVLSSIKKHRTVVWPTDEEVVNAVNRRGQYGAAVTPYLLMEWNRHLGGDQPTLITQIEHVLPVKPKAEWFQKFSAEEHENMRDLLANLLPLSKEMNQTLSNDIYTTKRPVYADDSGFKCTRQFAADFPDWNPATLKSRSQQLAGWAVSRWPHQ